MKKKILVAMLAASFAVTSLVGCGGSKEAAAPAENTEVVEETKEEVVEEVVEEAAADDEMVSDEKFAQIQDIFATLVDEYNQVKEYYESDGVEANADVEDVLNQTADIINEMAEITQEELTDADADTLLDTMVTLEDTLNLTIEAMNK